MIDLVRDVAITIILGITKKCNHKNCHTEKTPVKAEMCDKN